MTLLLVGGVVLLVLASLWDWWRDKTGWTDENGRKWPR